MDQKICKNCKYFEWEEEIIDEVSRDLSNNSGFCHRFPEKTHAWFTHWCGEFFPTPEFLWLLGVP